MDDFTLYIIIGVLAFVGALYAYGIYSKRQRAASFQELANKMMMSYTADDEAVQMRAGQFHLGGRGRGHKVRNALSGSQDGLNMTIFDHYFKTGYGRNTQHHNSTAIEIDSARLSLPFFTLRKKGFMQGLRNAFTKDHLVTLEGVSDEFAKNYVVVARNPGDEMSIQQLLTPDKQAFFARNNDYTIEGRDNMLLVYRERKQAKLDDIDTFMRDARDIFGQLASAESTWS